MNRTGLVIGVIVIVLLGLIVVLSLRNNNQANTEETPTLMEDTTDNLASPAVETSNAPSASPSSTAVAQSIGQAISYDGSSYTPSTLNVKVGDVVTFTNNSSTNIWVASDPHPVHTGLSGFDAKRPYAPGESYSYTFTKAGTFTFHDHLSPSKKGTVLVQ